MERRGGDGGDGGGGELTVYREILVRWTSLVMFGVWGLG